VLLGLTGGIGSGKSTVAALLAEHGAALIDADAVARALTEPGGAALPAIQHEFGTTYITPDGALNRPAMRDLAFTDPQAKARLEAITHPLVGQAMQTAVARQTARVVVLDIPLLVESPRWRPQLDWVWVVDCTLETQIQRVQARNGWPDKTIRNVIGAQASRSRRIAAADAVVFNDQINLCQLRAEIEELSRWLGL
jgi:dephospho-CoA kinase